mgnify:CR=1 FL=1
MLLKQQKIKEAFDHLLLIYEQDPNWNDSAAKQKLLEYLIKILKRRKMKNSLF